MAAESPIEAFLPSEQHRYDDLPSLDEATLHQRRERTFLILAGLFLGTLAMLNIVGITRFVDLSFVIPGTSVQVPMVVAVGVLPYPITFLCTDFISELYGRKRANQLVWVGLLLNIWVVFVIWLGGVLPGSPSPVYDGLKELAFAAVLASMIAYCAAQFVDVQLFHFWKRLTGGRHLWLRNNGSTLVSQLVDTAAVVLITHYVANGLPIDEHESVSSQLVTYIASGYGFKFAAGVIDTGPFYVGTHLLSRYLRLPPSAEAVSGTA